MQIKLPVSQLWIPAQLAVLAKVVDLNGFSAAARALGVPKAAVSRAVAELEKSLGVRLLERTTRRLSLTAAGKLLYPHAQQIVAECDAARALIARALLPAAGPLRVVADPTYGRILLTPLVPRFLERFPEVQLEVALQADPGVADREGGSWDVALKTQPSTDSGLACRELGSPPAVLCATPAYLEQRGQPTRPEDLRGHDVLTPESAEAPQYRLRLERGAQRAEVTLAPKLAISDPTVLHAATAAGLGVGLLPAFLCRQGVATGRLRPVLPEWLPPPAAALYAVYPLSLAPDQRVRHFVEFLAVNIVPALG
ncbi:MAG: LysR family transcriptional regulator [Sinobacteraceae bacterium]|nr:LysR family transcriptional regulator [Nevskiaceae bacterium]